MKGVDIWLPQLKNGDISINDKVKIIIIIDLNLKLAG